MDRRFRNLVLFISACVTGGLIAGLSCDPGYNNHHDAGAGGATSGSGGASGTGGMTGDGGASGVGGQTGQDGTGGESTAGSGGQTGAGGQNGAGTGGQNGAGTGGQNGTGGAGPTNNLITNGDFSNGDTSWSFQQVTGTGSAHSVTNGAYCVTVGSGQNLIVGWPLDVGAALHLPPGSYTLSYQASSSNTGVVGVMDAKVGMDITPYNADFESKTDPLTTSLQTLTHTFTTTAADNNCGLGFFINGPGGTSGATSQVCIDNVSLVAN